MSDTKIKCKICDAEMHQISYTHLKKHDITVDQYKTKFPNAPMRSLSCISRKKKSASMANESRRNVPRSKETIDKIIKTKKDNPKQAWNKNIPMLESQKRNLSDIRKKQYETGELIHWNKNNKTPMLVKEKIGKTLKQQNLHFSKESDLKRKTTITKKKENGWIHHNTLSFLKKLDNSLNKDATKLFDDKDWLYQKHITEKKSLASICVLLGLHWRDQAPTIGRQLKKFGIPIHRWSGTFSAQQEALESFILSLGQEIITNTRKLIPPYELDIYLPKHKLAIEYNGLFWHSESGGKDNKYHINKTELCEKAGIRLIHIFEDEWRDQQEKCKDTIKHILGMSEKGVYARNTSIREISWKDAKEFLNKYHLLNAGSSGNYRIGAFDKDNNLISVMVFGNQNNEKSNTNVIELRRFVTNKKNNPGLGSKMFKYAVREKKYKQVIAFVDRRWFTGLVKDHIGFTLHSHTLPATWWTDGKNRHHRRFITKQQLIKEGFDSQQSKHEILISKGFVRIWDCGKLKLTWEST